MGHISAHRLRGPSLAAALFGLALTASGGAAAQGVTSLTVFGDSFADTGSLVRLTGQPLTFPYANGRFSNGANFVDGLQTIYALPDAAVANFAIGGSTTSATNVAGPIGSLPQQVAAFRATGRRFGASDLVAVNIGGNDIIGPVVAGAPPAQTALLGAGAAADAVANVGQLVGAGARTIVFNAFTNVRGLPVVAFSGNAAAGDAFGRAYFAGLQAGLAPYAQAGTRIFLLDNAALQDRIAANPGRYGFVNTTLPCIGVAACAGGSRAVQNGFLSLDGIHLTEGGYLVLSRYMANALAAPNGIAAQAELGQVGTTSFASTLLQRLDALRPLGAVAATTGAGLGPTQAPPSPVIVWGQGGYAGGTLGARGYATGFTYDSPGGMIGVEALPQPGARFGLAFNYANPRATLQGGAGSIDGNAYQFAAYGSYNTANLFADGTFVYGRHDYAIVRPGVIDRIEAKTTGDGVAVAAKVGYLFDAWSGWRLGPIAGLTYASTAVNGYTERGDPVITQTVRGTGIDGLIGRLGGQLRTESLGFGSGLVIGFLNLTAEREFLNDGRTLVTSLTTTPLLPIQTPIGRASRAVYGQVEGGLSAELSPTMRATLTGGTTFARTGGDAFLINGGFTARF